jgi:hypothetical protein
MEDKPVSAKSKAVRERKERLKQALRANLKRRKQAAKSTRDRQDPRAEATFEAPPDCHD